MKVVLIRHGESQANKIDIDQIINQNTNNGQTEQITKKEMMITGHKRGRSKTIQNKSIPVIEQTNDVKKIVLDFKMRLKKDKFGQDENEEKKDSNISISEGGSTKTNSKDLEGSKELLKKVFTNFRLKNGIA